MFPDLEQAYQNSAQAGLIPVEARARRFSLSLGFFKRHVQPPQLDEEFRRYAPGAFLTNLLSDEEIRRYTQRIPKVIAQERFLQEAYSTKPKPPGWRMTDPEQHDNNNFRYLIHCLYYEKDYVSQFRNGDSDGFDRFLRSTAISCSIIDEIHRSSIGDIDNNSFHGFILNAPEDNIVGVSFRDMGKPTYLHYSPNVTAEEIERELAEEISLKKNMGGAGIFMKDADSVYNEVVINGDNDLLQVRAMYLFSDPFLDIPIYEIYSRIGRKGLEEIKRLETTRHALESDSALRLWTGGGSNLSTELWQASYYMKRYSEAKDLARLLEVPVVLIPLQVLPYYPSIVK